MHVGLSLLTLFPGRVGGSETVVRGLLGAFAAGGGPERLTLLGNRHLGTEYAGWPVRQIPAYRPGDSNLSRFVAMQAGRVYPRIDGREFDVVHYPFTVPVPRITGAARVVTLHDVQHHELPQLFSRAERWHRRWAYDGAARDADLVLTVSEDARRGITERLGVPADRIVVIPNGVDHERFTPDGPVREDLGDYVLYPANLWPHKNHDRLLAAWERAGTGLTLVLTGQTFGRSVDAPGVRHLGYVPDADVPALYRGARALLYPSLFEGFGVPVLEAMACGTPVAVSGRGSLAEVAGEAALTFDPEDVAAIAAAARRICADEPLRDELAAAGLRRAAEFSWGRAARLHVAAYEEALRRARRGRPAPTPAPAGPT